MNDLILSYLFSHVNRFPDRFRLINRGNFVHNLCPFFIWLYDKAGIHIRPLNRKNCDALIVFLGAAFYFI